MIESDVAVVVYQVTGNDARALEKLFKNHRQAYCERPTVGCGECSLVNYGLDCRNYPVAMEYGDPDEIVNLLESQGAEVWEGFECDGCIEWSDDIGASYLVTLTNPEFIWPDKTKRLDKNEGH